MGEQLHKKFLDEEVKSLLESYLSGEIRVEYVLQILGIKRRRFFELLNEYRNNPDGFTIRYKRKTKRRIKKSLEKVILKELEKEKEMIENKDISIKTYNYSYIKDEIFRKYAEEVSLPTIIKRAKENKYYIPRKERKSHDREVLTNYIGELIQHDTSIHKWSPYVEEKWYLITSLDDYSRYILHAALLEKESSWVHILALESVFLTKGIPLSYYVDCHSIFRFVQGRDSIWRENRKVTDEVEPQWKQVLSDCNVKVTYALSPQAKGKIERPYQWLQDRIVRTCAREDIRTIEKAREVLKYEVDRYNNRQVHSTTKEIPAIRFDRALREKKSLFREFKVRPPYLSTKDIFCLREERTVDAYRKISINNLQLKVQDAPIREKIQLRIYPDIKTGVAEVRFWYEGKLLDVQKVKNSDLKLVHF
ncbi:MAG: hypothetical protein AAB257_03850 [Nitrospinota bacterium]